MSNNLYHQPVILGSEHGVSFLPYFLQFGELIWNSVVDHERKTITVNIHILEYEE